MDRQRIRLRGTKHLKEGQRALCCGPPINWSSISSSSIEYLGSSAENCLQSLICVCLLSLPFHLAIGRTLIPRYFRSIFEGGATELYYVLKHPKESFHNNFVSLDCDQCTMVTQHGKPMFTQVRARQGVLPPPTMAERLLPLYDDDSRFLFLVGSCKQPMLGREYAFGAASNGGRTPRIKASETFPVRHYDIIWHPTPRTWLYYSLYS